MTEPDFSFYRYHSVARTLHWAIGALVILNLIGGFLHDEIGRGIPVMPLHKATGITVLVLTLVRIGWKVSQVPPPLPAAMPAWEKAAARGTHLAFYGLLILMPLTGWIMSSAGTRPLSWFWLFDIPKFGVQKGDAIVALSGGAHEVLGILFAVLALIHVFAALRHHFLLKDDVLRRMIG